MTPKQKALRATVALVLSTIATIGFIYVVPWWVTIITIIGLSCGALTRLAFLMFELMYLKEELRQKIEETGYVDLSVR